MRPILILHPPLSDSNVRRISTTIVRAGVVLLVQLLLKQAK